MNKRPQILKQISLRKSFYTNTHDNLIHAIQYIEDHPDIGHLNHVILESFRTLYAPLGLLENSEANEARRVALNSIASLEAHIQFLREMFEMPEPSSPMPANMTPAQTPVPQTQPEKNTAPEPLSETEQIGLSLFESFSQD
ncbi:MAG: hypothetical protein AB4038_21810 [Prochloraceae cyanobacterium]